MVCCALGTRMSAFEKMVTTSPEQQFKILRRVLVDHRFGQIERQQGGCQIGRALPFDDRIFPIDIGSAEDRHPWSPPKLVLPAVSVAPTAVAPAVGADDSAVDGRVCHRACLYAERTLAARARCSPVVASAPDSVSGRFCSSFVVINISRLGIRSEMRMPWCQT